MSVTWPSLRVNALILLLVVVQCNQECLDGFQYLCGAQQITIIKGNPLYLAAPGSPPTCNLNAAADCGAEIQAKAGLKIELTAVIALPTCGGNNYVELSDGVSAPLRVCSGNITNGSFADSALNVTFRSSNSSNVMSITLSAVGCPVEELITGLHISADVERTTNRHRYNAYVKCSSGYLMNNQSNELSVACAQIAAVQTYHWENPGDKYTCQAAQCLAPPTVQNATHNGTLSRYSYLSTVSYNCNQGYLMSGNRSKQCVTENNRGAIWSDGTTQCQPVLCLTPPSISNGSFRPQRSSYPYASTVTYSCNQGYLLTGSAEITCTADSDIQAMWTSLSASCQPARCSTPPTVQYATNDGTLTTYPYLSTVNYTCNPGYLISGNRTMLCSTQNNVANWSNTSLQCQAAVCTDPPSLSNGTYTPSQSSYRYPDVITYNCYEGFVLKGNNRSRCTTSSDIEAAWTLVSASCQQAECPNIRPPQFFSNLTDVPDLPVAGDTVSYQCVLDNTTVTLTCLSDGVTGYWNGSLSACFTSTPAEMTGHTKEGLGVIIGAIVGGVAAVVLVLSVILILSRRQMFGKNGEHDRSESTAAIVDGRPESTGSGLYADVELVPARTLPKDGAAGQTVVGKSKKSSAKPAGSEPKQLPEKKEHSKSHDVVAPNDDPSQMYAAVLKPSAATGSSKRPIVVDRQVELVDNELYAPTLMVPAKSVSLASQDTELDDNDLYST